MMLGLFSRTFPFWGQSSRGSWVNSLMEKVNPCKEPALGGKQSREVLEQNSEIRTAEMRLVCGRRYL